MKISPGLRVWPLVVASSLVYLSHGMPQAGSNADGDLSFDKRDDKSYYVVYGKNTSVSNPDQVMALWTYLRAVASKVSNETDLVGHGTDIGVAFWSLPLTDDYAEIVAAYPNVSSIVRGCTKDCADPTDDDQDDSNTDAKRSIDKTVTDEAVLSKRDDGLVNSHKIDPEMVFISLPDQEEVEDYEDFVYDKSAGSDVTVYILDTGASLSNDDEFSNFVRPNVKWLHAAGTFPRDPTEDDNHGVGRGHGTGVLAKAAGWEHGIAKRSNPVVIRVNRKSDPAAWLDGITQAYSDWQVHHYIGHETTATAILNLSWGWSIETLTNNGYNDQERADWIKTLREHLNACVAIGLLPIAPSGNSQPTYYPNLPVNQWPQLLAYGNPAQVPDMMLVGGVGTDGTRWAGSRVDPADEDKVIKVYAPSYDLKIPDASTGGYRVPTEVTGTSYASGTVAGLGTYLLGLSSLSNSLLDDDPVQRVRNLKDELETVSCISRVDDFCGLNNLIDPEKCLPDVPDDFQDGDEVECK